MSVSVNDQPNSGGDKTSFKQLLFSVNNQPFSGTHCSPAVHSHHSFVPTRPTNFSNPATGHYPGVESGESSDMVFSGHDATTTGKPPNGFPAINSGSRSCYRCLNEPKLKPYQFYHTVKFKPQQTSCSQVGSTALPPSDSAIVGCLIKLVCSNQKSLDKLHLQWLGWFRS